MRRNLLLFVCLTAFSCLSALAQVTTSGISGQVVDPSNHPVAGAAVIAVHVPTGTQYGAVSDAKGNYRLTNLRPGGPYTVTTRMLGYKALQNRVENLALGDNRVLRVQLTEESMDIDAVVVQTEGGKAIMSSDRAGTLTNVNSRELSTLPSINRSVLDFTRLTPQAGNNNSFAGRDGRFNNLTIDGASFNNRFGVSTDLLPGGHAQPISLDAIQEVTINLSPYDIRESNFTGASVNAVTRSGTNAYTASVYTYFQPRSCTGEKVGDRTVLSSDKAMHNFGFTVGGPIVKDKLFVFVNAEWERSDYRQILWQPTYTGAAYDAAGANKDGDAATFRARTTDFDLKRIKQALHDNYQYDPGVWENFPNFEDKNYKVTARLDWNINKNHKAMVRYNEVVGTYDQMVNSSSVPSGFGYMASGRYSVNSIAFGNSNYGFENTVRSITGELNSTFSPRVSNKFLASYTHVRDLRTSPSTIFPTVDIFENGVEYMTFGYEPFSGVNDVVNNTFSVTNNLTIALGDHTLTAGASYENQYLVNAYMRFPYGYYRYNSVQDFLDNVKPAGYAIQYPYGDDKDPKVDMTFGLASAYVQDEWQVNPKLKITAGVRFEMPLYLSPLQSGTRIDGMGNVPVSQMAFDGGISYDQGHWPKSYISASPRVGFNWDVLGDRTIQLRGGTGLFTGYNPFVWFTNQPGSMGFVQAAATSNKINDLPADFRFAADYNTTLQTYPAVFPQKRGTVVSNSDLAKVSDDFRLPKVWRSSLAADIQLPWTTILTVEAMYTKDIHAIMQKNVNLPTLDVYSPHWDGPDNRAVWLSNWGYNPATRRFTGNANKVQSNVGSFCVLDNTDKGHQMVLTAQLTKRFDNGLAGMIGYTYNRSRDIGSNPGSTAFSAWRANTSAGSLNGEEMGYSLFAVPHRVTGYVSYTISYAKNFASTFALYYTGSHGMRVNYKSDDMNGDGNAFDLIYVPATLQESKDMFEANGAYTAEQQGQDFWDFINDNNYLKSRKGQYAERGGGLSPWVNRFDFKFTQDIFSNFGGSKRYSLQFTWDVLNVGNLLNKEWGAVYTANNLSYNDMQLLRLSNVRTVAGQNGQPDKHYPLYRLNNQGKDATSTREFRDATTFKPTVSTASTWACMFGLRLKF